MIGGSHSGNSRNGATTSTLNGDFGEVPLETSRDRNGNYEPKVIGKGQTRFPGFDDKIVSMYAGRMSTREVQGHLEEIYKVEVSPTLISTPREGDGGGQNWQRPPPDAVIPSFIWTRWWRRFVSPGTCATRRLSAGQAEGAKFWLQGADRVEESRRG